MADERVVQTLLEEHEYERFRWIADEEGVSLEEALSRAVQSYVEEKTRVNPDDPLFTIVDELEDNVGDRTNAGDMDADLYGLCGSEK